MTLVHTHNLFAGAGGWELGLEMIGVPRHATTGIDPRPKFVECRQAAGLETVVAEVTEVPIDSLAEHRLFPRTLLVGQPPCPTFSVAGLGSGHRDAERISSALAEYASGGSPDVSWEDSRTQGILEPMRYISAAHRAGTPYDYVILEEVPPAMTVFNEYASHLRDLGYSASARVLSMEQYGLPQTRRRAFLMASLHDEVAWPAPTHRSYSSRRKRDEFLPDEESLLPWLTMSDAVGWGWTRRPAQTMTVVGPLTSWSQPQDIYSRGVLTNGWVDNPRQITRPRADTGKLGVYIKPRGFEIGVMQGFPIDHPWAGANSHQFQQSGSAMPPIMVAHLARALGIGEQLPLETPLYDRQTVLDYETKTIRPPKRKAAA